VVDNGSTDRTKEIVQDMVTQYPQKIKFFDVPELPDLHHNRQYALERASYRWIVRADSDYVAYTSGKYDIMKFRERLLAEKRRLYPLVFSVPAVNISGDFGHTGLAEREGGFGVGALGWYVPPPITMPNLRIYEYFPGFKFQRHGRWEATSFSRLLHYVSIELPDPLWMHCNLKSNLNYLYRSERTNWRQLGDYKQFPTLDDYMAYIVPIKYGTDDLVEAAQQYLRQNLYPFLQPYDANAYYPYPELVREQMAKFWPYEIVTEPQTGHMSRVYHGPIVA
ncbi:MAG: glycosyltransferase family 2 protein, partial [Anaerolineales bacterium]|nr:glycosyltransferase family 2 protein [Anaerolineales bacterium]